MDKGEFGLGAKGDVSDKNQHKEQNLVKLNLLLPLLKTKHLNNG
jgi:hypothetical protein